MPLDDLKEFVSSLASAGADVNPLALVRAGLPKESLGNVGVLYCPHCSEYSGMKLNTLHFEKTVGQELYKEITREDSIGPGPRPKLPEYFDPSLFRLDCVNCQNGFYTLLYKIEKGPTLVFFSTRGGGIATPNTPTLVRYYLEQAYKAQAASAYSAAIAMYRAALEQVLQDKGFEGKLPSKLANLAERIKDGTAPSWAKRLNDAALTVIKEIADSHAHPSELSKLQALDIAFMSNVQKTFCSLLSLAYEQDARKAAGKAKLEAVLQKAKKKGLNLP